MTIVTGAARDQEPSADSGMRRGLQKRLVNLFDGVWIPKSTRSGQLGVFEST